MAASGFELRVITSAPCANRQPQEASLNDFGICIFVADLVSLA